MYTVYAGELVRLRPYRDLAEMQQLISKSSERPNDHWGPWYWPTGAQAKDFEPAGMLDPGKYSQFAIERLDTGEVVGSEEHGKLEPGAIANWLGTDILRPHWHKGYGIEAKQLMLCYLFENFPLQMVFADTCLHHTRAQNGLAAIGMRYVGALRGVHYAGGVFYDIVHYQIFREEWEQQEYRHKVKRGA